MKKAVVIMSVLIHFVFLAGCIEYKSFPGKDKPEEQDLLDEIALIDEELGLGSDKAEAAKPAEGASKEEEEVVLPALGEENSDAQVITDNENELVKLNVKANDADNDENIEEKKEEKDIEKNYNYYKNNFHYINAYYNEEINKSYDDTNTINTFNTSNNHSYDEIICYVDK